MCALALGGSNSSDGDGVLADAKSGRVLRRPSSFLASVSL